MGHNRLQRLFSRVKDVCRHPTFPEHSDVKEAPGNAPKIHARGALSALPLRKSARVYSKLPDEFLLGEATRRAVVDDVLRQKSSALGAGCRIRRRGKW